MAKDISISVIAWSQLHAGIPGTTLAVQIRHFNKQWGKKTKEMMDTRQGAEFTDLSTDAGAEKNSTYPLIERLQTVRMVVERLELTVKG